MVQALDDKENIDEIGMVKMNFTEILDYIVKVMASSQYRQMAMHSLIMKEDETMDWMYISASSFKMSLILKTNSSPDEFLTMPSIIAIQNTSLLGYATIAQIHHPMGAQPGHLAQDKPRMVKSRIPHPWARWSKYILGIETRQWEELNMDGDLLILDP
eukprot:Gb_13029 [translate_table: standard]